MRRFAAGGLAVLALGISIKVWAQQKAGAPMVSFTFADEPWTLAFDV